MLDRFKMKSQLVITGVIFFVLLLTMQGFSQAKGSGKIDLKDDLPRGKWSLSFHTYQGNDFLEYPVIAFSVTSKNTAVERFSIANISNKAVTAIKVAWLLHEDDNRSSLLDQNSTRLLNFVKPLAPGASGFIRYPVVSLKDFSQQFLVNKQLNRNFDVDLLVEEVHYADGSSWQRSQGKSPDINAEFASRMAPSLDCPKQKCVASESGTVRGGVTYSCGGSTLNEVCTNSSNATSCTNSACNTGGDGGFEIEIGAN